MGGISLLGVFRNGIANLCFIVTLAPRIGRRVDNKRGLLFSLSLHLGNYCNS